MNQEKIGKFIIECRRNKNLTQQELADRLGITDRAISHWEHGRCLPDASLFKPLCEILDISVNELLSGERFEKKEIINKSDKLLLQTINYSSTRIRNQKIRFIIIIILLLLVIFFSMFISDYKSILKSNNPNYMIKICDNELKTVYVGLGYKLTRYNDVNHNTKFGFWFFQWDVDIPSTSPPLITVINGENRVYTNIGSFCIRNSISHICSDSIDVTEFNYDETLYTVAGSIISINDDSVKIKNVNLIEIKTGEQIDAKINSKDYSFVVPNIKGTYYVKIDTYSDMGNCWYSFKVDIK